MINKKVKNLKDIIKLIVEFIVLFCLFWMVFLKLFNFIFFDWFKYNGIVLKNLEVKVMFFVLVIIVFL